MVTIREIAKRSNVTPGLVSMVLNGKGKASPETRSRIEAVVAELGYRHRSVGRPRRANAETPRSIAVVYAQRVASGGQLSRLSQDWIGGIREIAIETGSHLNLIGGFADAARDEMFRHALDAGHVDGVILIGITANDGQSYLTQSLNHRLPTVVMNRTPAHAEFSYVSMDNFGTGRIAIDHLVALGHQKIAMIHPTVTERYAVDRQMGGDAGLAAHRLTSTCTVMIEPNATNEELARACRQIVDSRATAVYATAGDEPASRCIDIWHSMGVRVPADLSVIGWDDVGPTSACGLLCSSVGYDRVGMGREAALMLLDLFRRGKSICSRGLVMPTRIVDHDSTGPAPTGVQRKKTTGVAK